MQTPQVSVLTTAYNCAPYLRQTVDSVLGQAFGDFELILVDDASTDGTLDLVMEYARLDPRVRALRSDRNLGPAGASNIGLRAASAPLIARLDSDDLAHPERLQRQVAFMQRNPAVDVLGSWMRVIDEQNSEIGSVWRLPPSHVEIVWGMLFNCTMAHPASMYRKSALPATLYREGQRAAEDLRLWCELAIAGARFANLQEPLVSYRIRRGQIGDVRRGETEREATAARSDLLSRVLRNRIDRDRIERFIAFPGRDRERADIRECYKFLRFGAECIRGYKSAGAIRPEESWPLRLIWAREWRARWKTLVIARLTGRMADSPLATLPSREPNSGEGEASA